jgi:hypothetical protein
MVAPECTDDVDCQSANKNVNSHCFVLEGLCKLTCATDLDCSTNLAGALTQVCNADRVCEDIGCTQDTECKSSTSPSVQMFCTPKLTAAEAGGASSAITTGN